MKTLTCHGDKFKDGELIRPFRVIWKQAQSVSFWYTITVPKQTEKAKTDTARGDALRRTGGSNVEVRVTGLEAA